MEDYRRRLAAFDQWLRVCRRAVLSLEDLDAAFVEYLDKLFFEGVDIGEGTKLLSGLKLIFPSLSRWGPAHLPRAARALQGWSKAAPPLQRLPFPWMALCAVVGLLLHQGQLEPALALLLSFSLYLRPGECDSLQAVQVVPPVVGAGGGLSCLGVLLHPTEQGRPGKTGLWDASILLDNMPFLVPALLELRRRRLGGRLWGYPLGSLGPLFAQACEALHLRPLRPCLYGLRHGGASEDMIQRHRTVPEIKLRGRWASDASLRRYMKVTRLLSELGKVPALVLAYGAQVSGHLAAILEGRVPCPPPPRL